jgi:hypothetical protein
MQLTHNGEDDGDPHGRVVRPEGRVLSLASEAGLKVEKTDLRLRDSLAK